MTWDAVDWALQKKRFERIMIKRRAVNHLIIYTLLVVKVGGMSNNWRKDSGGGRVASGGGGNWRARGENLGERKARETRTGDVEGAAVAFESLTLVSRKIGPPSVDEMDEASLRDRSIQVKFFAHIVERRKRLAESDAAKNGGAVDWDPVLASFRKLREGIVSAGVKDAFAVEVYEASAGTCLDAGNFAELLKSLTVLVGVLYPYVSATNPVVE
ncbi:hypothetical protein HK101_004106, partial [Irineochytrium annulatum]